MRESSSSIRVRARIKIVEKFCREPAAQPATIKHCDLRSLRLVRPKFGMVSQLGDP